MNLLLEKLNQIWPDWKIVEKIGEGSFGEVYKAVRQDFAGTTYSAIKAICIPKSEEEIEELKAEGYSLEQSYTYFKQVVKDYTHEIQMMDSVKGYTNVVSIDDYKIVESDDDMLWYIFIRMELLTPLVKKVAIDEITESDVIQAGIDLCSALDLCRKKNIVHRDIKPQNIFVNDEGNYKLGDFGIARRLNRSITNLSKKGAPNYMAPELYKSALQETNIDDAVKVDIYSLGLVLYWMANNSKLPFLPTDKQIATPEDRERAFIRRISGEALPGPARVSPELQRIILKACAYKPEDRYASAEEMKRDLIGDPPSPPPPPSKKTRWLILLIATAVALLLYLLPEPGGNSYLMKTINAVIPTATRIPAVTTQEEEIPSSEENVWSEWSEKRNASDDSKQTVRSEQISADEVISTPSSIFGLSSDGTTIMLPSTGEFSSSAAFPQDVIQDTSELCSQYNGTPVECLGLTGKAGCNLRSVPTIDGTLSYDKNRQQEYTHPSIVRKLHADITVYVYFSFINASSDKWYYVTCADGQTGFVLAKRIILDAK